MTYALATAVAECRDEGAVLDTLTRLIDECEGEARQFRADAQGCRAVLEMVAPTCDRLEVKAADYRRARLIIEERRALEARSMLYLRDWFSESTDERWRRMTETFGVPKKLIMSTPITHSWFRKLVLA